MAGETSVAVRVLAIVSLVALADRASCQLALADRALPPTVACGAVGRFPDPTDCHFYLDCSTDGSSGYTQTITLCPDGTYYDACTGNCSTQFEGECTIPCNIDNLITDSTQNPAIIFVCHIDASGSSTITVSTCSTEFERLGICSSSAKQCEPLPGASMCKELGAGYHTDEKDCSVYYYCSNEDASPVKLVCPTDQYFNMSYHSCVEFECTSEGVFADPLDCMRYYTCTKSGSRFYITHIECPTGEYFDSSTETCVTGICPIVCPAAKFSCPSSGYFADPDRYSSYYYCDNNLQATHFSCPGRRHFDSDAGSCLMGSGSNRMV